LEGRRGEERENCRSRSVLKNIWGEKSQKEGKKTRVEKVDDEVVEVWYWVPWRIIFVNK
jgi:hypothetical protein